MSPSPRIGVAVIVIKSGRVLLGKRKGSHGEGTWAFPGGHLRFGETVEDCARRELMEETGLSIKDLTLGPYTNDLFSEENKHYITLYVVARYAKGQLENREPEKCDGWEWFHWNRLPHPRFLSLANLSQLSFDPVAFLKAAFDVDKPCQQVT